MDRIAGPDHRYYVDGATNHDRFNCRGGNIVYADGHVAWIRLQDTIRAAGGHDTLCNIPLDDNGRGIPHIGFGGLNWYDTYPTVINAQTIKNRGYLYNVP